MAADPHLSICPVHLICTSQCISRANHSLLLILLLLVAAPAYRLGFLQALLVASSRESAAHIVWGIHLSSACCPAVVTNH
jgi:hypothetical protein